MKLLRSATLAALASFFLFAVPGRAANVSTEEYSENARVEEAVDEMSQKFWRGFVNVFTGLGEFPRQMSRACEAKGKGKGIPVGFFNGLLMTCVRTGVGAFEVVTFPVPTTPDDNTPAKMSYVPVMEPAYVWEKN